MSKVVQVRGVPEAIHAVLSKRAARAGMSLSDYCRRELEVAAQRDANEELLNRLAELPPPHSSTTGPSAAEIIREMREERDTELLRRVTGP